MKDILLPAIEREVNEGKTFANLRQIYHAVILATWYKNNLRDSVLGQSYVDQNKTKGVDIKDKDANQKIYNQYLEAFKKGAYDFIKEDYDPESQQIIPRKYFSGGVNFQEAVTTVEDVNPAMLSSTLDQLTARGAVVERVKLAQSDKGQLGEENPPASPHVSQVAQTLYWKVNVEESETQQTPYVIQLVKQDVTIDETKKRHQVPYKIFVAPLEKVKFSEDIIPNYFKGRLVLTFSSDGRLIEDAWDMDINDNDLKSMPWLPAFLSDTLTAKLKHSFIDIEADLTTVLNNASAQIKFKNYSFELEKWTRGNVDFYRRYHDHFLNRLDKFGFEEPEVLPLSELFNTDLDAVNIAMMGGLSEDGLSFMQAASYEPHANFFFALPQTYDVINNGNKTLDKLPTISVQPRFMFRNGRPYFILSDESVLVDYIVDKGGIDTAGLDIPVPGHSYEDDYINEKDISMMILKRAGTVNVPKWRSIIVSDHEHERVNNRRASSNNVVKLDQHDEALKEKLGVELLKFLDDYDLKELVAKPNDGARGKSVEFVDMSNYLAKAAVIANQFADGTNFILQERITPPLVELMEEGKKIYLDYNFRVFVSPIDGKATTFGKVVRIDKTGQAVNLSLSAKAWLTERLAEELKLSPEEYQQLNGAVDYEAEATFEAINEAMIEDGVLAEGENATDFMGVDIIVRRIGEDFFPYVIEVNDFNSGAMWDLDNALRETGEQYFSPEEVKFQIGLANKGWIAEIIRRAQNHKGVLFYDTVRLRDELAAGFNHGERMTLRIFRYLLQAVYLNKKELSLDQKSEFKKVLDYLLSKIIEIRDKSDDAFYQKLYSAILNMKESGVETAGVFQTKDGIHSREEFILFFVDNLRERGSVLIDGFFNYPALAQSLDLRAEMLLRGILAEMYDLPKNAIKSDIVKELFGSEEKLKSVVQTYVASINVIQSLDQAMTGDEDAKARLQQNTAVAEQVGRTALGEMKPGQPYIIGIGGPSGVGKTTFSDEMMEGLVEAGKRVLKLNMDKFHESYEIREILGTEWDELHMRVQEAHRVLAAIKAGDKLIPFQAFDRGERKILEEVIDLTGIDAVVVEHLYAISREERLGNLLKFVDLPVYIDADMADFKQWRIQQEQKKKIPRTPEQMEKHWDEGILPDTIKNVQPSRNNARIVIMKDHDHVMTIVDQATVASGGEGDIPENIRVLIAKLNLPVEGYQWFLEIGLAPHVAFLKTYAVTYGINPDLIPNDIPVEVFSLLGRSFQGDEDANRFPQLKKFVAQMIEVGLPLSLSKMEAIKIAARESSLVTLHELGHFLFLAHPELWQDFINDLMPTIKQRFSELSRWFGGSINAPTMMEPLLRAAENLDSFLQNEDREVVVQLILNLSDIFAFALAKSVGDTQFQLKEESFLIDEAMKFVERRGFLVEGDVDAASLASRDQEKISSSDIEANKGGIDLNPAAMDLQTQGDAFKYNLPRGEGGAGTPGAPGVGVPSFDIQGLYPVIIHIMPIADYLPTIGIRDAFSPDQNLVFRPSVT